MIDLYLPRQSYTFRRSRYFVERKYELARQLSVSLVDARAQPPLVDPLVGPHGEAFARGLPVLWFDQALAGDYPENAWLAYDDSINQRLAKDYGVISAAPLVDQLGNNCVGVLVVHVGPEADRAIRAIGALRSPEGKRRLTNACVELNGLLAR